MALCKCPPGLFLRERSGQTNFTAGLSSVGDKSDRLLAAFKERSAMPFLMDSLC